MTLSIGFTGNQEGMTRNQKESLTMLLKSTLEWNKILNNEVPHFHHGDCIGSDSEAHDIAEALGYVIDIHPPINPMKRAYKQTIYGTRFPDREYLERNQDICASVELLIAAPKKFDDKLNSFGIREELRSGTWATVRYMRMLGKKRIILDP